MAPNGLGHFRRQVGIISRLLGRVGALRARIICSEGQIRATRDWDRAIQLFADPRVDYQTGIVDDAVVWSATAPPRTDASLASWRDRLSHVRDLSDVPLVISDNLSGVLTVRGDAILAGSFLWGDILARTYPHSAEIRSFARFESELLHAHRPRMLCVRDLVMPAVIEQTRALPLGWMCESDRRDARRGARPRVALLGGATGAADALLARAGRALTHANAYDLTAPTRTLPDLPGVAPFGHAPDDYAALSVAVVRPGVGTVSDCVAQAVPMVTLHEGPTNPELAHNGSRLGSMGIAIDLGPDPTDAAIVASVARAAESRTAAEMRSRLDALPRTGLAEAVDFLIQRLNGDGAS